MEELHNLDSQLSDSGSELSEKSTKYLLEAARWSKFLAIVAFIGIGLSLIITIFTVATAASRPYFSGYELIPVLLTIVILGLYFFPALNLFNFAVKMKNGIVQNKAYEIEDAFEAIKSFFKFFGILTIVILSIYVLIFIIGGMAGIIR